jgi:hypothetical protein
MLEFGFTQSETGYLMRAIHDNLTKEEQRQTKGIQYWLLFNRLNGSSTATEQEVKIAEKLSIVNKINLGELIMELKELKGFAKEVGLGIKDIKDLDEDELIIKILQNVDGDKEYSEEFAEWYGDLDDEYFNEAEALEEEEEKPKAKGKGKKVEDDDNDDDEDEDEGDSVNIDEIKEAVNECKTVEEIEEVLNDFGVEGFDPEEYKSVRAAKKAVIEMLDSAGEEEEEEEKPAPKAKGKGKNVKEEEEKPAEKKRGRPAKAKEEEKAEDDDNEEVIAAINECSSTEELKDLADDYEVFASVKFRTGRGKSPYRDFDEVKGEMLNLLGVEADNDEKEEETEVTPEVIKALVKAKDADSLASICEQLNIPLRALEKKIVQKMADKILEVIGEEEKEEEKPEPKGTGKRGRPAKKTEEDADEPAEERKSLYQVVEEMVLANKSDKEIIKAVTPVWKSRGKNDMFIKKWVKEFTTIVESDHGIDPDERG